MNKTPRVMPLFIRCLAIFWGLLAAGGVMARHDGPHLQAAASGEDVAGRFDYYLLSLSWSPTYCLSNPGDRAQCSGKGFGFVLHGLWPQYNGKGWPQSCATANQLDREAQRFADTVFPNSQLARHEWQKHGTCSGLNALDYFKLADHARNQLKIPKTLETPSQPLMMRTEEIVAAFMQANPGLPAHAVFVSCRGPELQEVRACLGKDLTFKACDKGMRSNCRSGTIRIPAVR